MKKTLKEIFILPTFEQFKTIIILWLAIIVGLMFWSISARADDYLYFADELVTQGEQSGYVLGTGLDQVIVYIGDPRLEVLVQDLEGSGKDVIRFRTSNPQHLVMAHTMSEFLGTGYVDMLARVAYGISNFNAAQISRLLYAQWQIGDGWISGPLSAWIAAGKPLPVRITRGVLILGREGDMD